jgi:hypothetical protein
VSHLFNQDEGVKYTGKACCTSPLCDNCIDVVDMPFDDDGLFVTCIRCRERMQPNRINMLYAVKKLQGQRRWTKEIRRCPQCGALIGGPKPVCGYYCRECQYAGDFFSTGWIPAHVAPVYFEERVDESVPVPVYRPPRLVDAITRLRKKGVWEAIA